ncbi:Cytosolic sulfotransferase 18, partial [Linum grandiflorum]
LKDLDINKNGKPYPKILPHLTNNLFFRRGEVGDWRNYLSTEVAKYIDNFTRLKFRGTGLYLDEDQEEVISSLSS